MIIEILEYAESAVKSLNYSLDKFYQGQAEIVGYGNMPNDLPSFVMMTFRERESMPSVDCRIRSCGFHVAFNPGPDDSMSENRIPELVAEYLERMGYGGQPYIIFGHSDIERGHYHVVSSRIRPDGSAIGKSFDHTKTKVIGQELGKKYGFIIGKDKSKKEVRRTLEELTGPKLRLDHRKPIREQLSAIVERAHEFDYETPTQFLAILEAFGVAAMAKKRKNGKPGISACGIDEDGNFTTRLFALDKTLKTDIVNDFNNRRAQNRSGERTYDIEDARMAAPASCCLQWTRSESEYKAMLSAYGYYARITRNETGEPKDIVIIDKMNRRVNNLTTLDESCDLSVVKKWKKKSGTTNIDLTEIQKAKIETVFEYKRLKWGLVSETEKESMRRRFGDSGNPSKKGSKEVAQIRLAKD